MAKPRILGISGSLRRESFNTAVLNTVKEALADKIDMTLHPLGDIPLFNQDDEGDPAKSVTALRDAIRNADALIVSSPEYNHSTSGVLKNALDWASRPFGQSSYAGKPVLIITASPAATGGARAHSHLYDVFLASDAKVIGGPQIAVAGAGGKVSDGRLTDQATVEFISKAVDRLTQAI